MTDAHDRTVAWGQQLRITHNRLRAAIDRDRAAIDAGDPSAGPNDLAVFCGGFCRSLDAHHRAEDDQLFRAIRSRAPELGSVLEKLNQDHQILAGLIAAFESAIASDSDTESLHRHLDGIEAIMQTHFRYEEAQLVAVLDRMELSNRAESLDETKARVFGAGGG